MALVLIWEEEDRIRLPHCKWWLLLPLSLFSQSVQMAQYRNQQKKKKSYSQNCGYKMLNSS